MRRCDHGGVTVERADAGEVIRLWPDGPPFRIEGVGAEVDVPRTGRPAVGTTFLRNISDPTLTVFPPAADRANGVGVIVVPGRWVDASRVDPRGPRRGPVARRRRLHGLPAQVPGPGLGPRPGGVRRPDGGHRRRPGRSRSAAQLPRAITDLIATDEYVRPAGRRPTTAAAPSTVVRERPPVRLRPDAVGMIGFSAGAFLPSTWRWIPQAPLAFVGADLRRRDVGAPVPADAPPLFTVVAHDDLLAPSSRALHADWSARRPTRQSCTCSPRGAHGFGMVRQGAPSDRWPDLFLAWLDDLALR